MNDNDLLGENIDITADEMCFLRTLGDFDLKMFLSEIDEHGWPAARKLLPLIRQSVAKNGAPT